MEIIHIAVPHSFCNLIHPQGAVIQQLLRPGDKHLVQIGIKVYVQLLCKQLSQIRTVVAEKRRQCLKLQILLIIMPDIMQDFIQYIFLGGIADRSFKVPVISVGLWDCM